jgi:hypothetical protein
MLRHRSGWAALLAASLAPSGTASAGAVIQFKTAGDAASTAVVAATNTPYYIFSIGGQTFESTNVNAFGSALAQYRVTVTNLVDTGGPRHAELLATATAVDQLMAVFNPTITVTVSDTFAKPTGPDLDLQSHLSLASITPRNGHLPDGIGAVGTIAGNGVATPPSVVAPSQGVGSHDGNLVKTANTAPSFTLSSSTTFDFGTHKVFGFPVVNLGSVSATASVDLVSATASADLVSAPEPSTLASAVSGGALVGGVAFLRRRKKARPA